MSTEEKAVAAFEQIRERRACCRTGPKNPTQIYLKQLG
jgi:hypothetical protein